MQQTQRWAFVFPQERSLKRAIALAFGILCGVGKRTLTRAISFQGNTQKDWSADYKVCSRSPWEPQALFHPILEHAITEHQLKRLVFSTDDTRVWRTGKNGRTYHRQPAYLLTTDLTTPAELLLQDDFDRWGIEVNHRDEKEILGVGQAQVWNERSVKKVPALLVAMYSWLLLGGLHGYGPTRTEDYDPLPKWRRGARRPSCLDLVALLRKQVAERLVKLPTAKAAATCQIMVGTAAA